MKITCGSCAAKYTVSDEKVQGKTVKVKCRKCTAVIVVSSTGEVQTTGGNAPPAGSAAAAALSASYSVSVSDSDQRTLTMDQIVNAYNDGVIDAETYVWTEGMADWSPLKDVDVIVDALHEAAAAAEPEEEEDDLGSTMAIPEGAAGMLAAAAAAAPAPAPMMAAPAPAVMTTPMAAVPAAFPAPAAGLDSTVAMTTEQAMAGSMGSYGSQPAAARAAQPSASSALLSGGSGSSFFGSSGSGAAAASASSPPAGSENSAIFSLSMLTAKAGPTEDKTTATSEDSGLIDLKALAAGMGGDSGGGIAAAEPTPGGLFPLGAPAPMAAAAPVQSAMLDEAKPAGTSRGLIFALVGVVVALGAVVVFLLVSRGGDETKATNSDPTNTAAVTAAPTETAAPTATADASVEPTATATADASASATASAAARPPTAGPRPPTAGPRPPTAGPRPPTPRPPTPVPGGGACGCNPSDLMCLMRCKGKK